MAKLPYLNIGCGTTFHNDWVNVDFASTGEDVLAHNLLEGIPYEDGKFEVVYHSHVLEHFLKPDADQLIQECYRVLKPGGILRVAIPDLERIARNYLKYLEEADKNIPGAAEKYNWTMLEMYDQTVRTRGGGDMVTYIADRSRNNDEFLLERNGQEAKLLMENIRNPKPHVGKVSKGSIMYRIKGKLKDWLLKEDQKALAIGKFRLGGEIHQWMYDRYSLSELFKKHGFKEPVLRQFNESAIPDWNSFGLDSAGGKVRKPDSLFMEATK